MASKLKHTDYIIAIDGFSACGKSTLARDLAKSLKYIFIDSGAMYRAVTLYAINNHIPFDQIENHLENIHIEFKVIENQNIIFLNGENVAQDIRSKKVNDAVSLIAKIPQVRRFLVKQQQAFGLSKGVVMDGRDIGTVVFPDADLKFFITADLAVRTQRRALEMGESGKEVSKETIQKNLLERDHIDSTRQDSPLKKAKDAIRIDNTKLTKKEQLDLCLQYVQGLR